MTTHPCGAFLLITQQQLDQQSERLLPCPFCGTRAQLEIQHSGRQRLRVRCAISVFGSPPCEVRPWVGAPNALIHVYSKELRTRQPHTYQGTIDDLVRIWNTRVPTKALNRWLEAVLDRHPPPAVSGRRIKIRYATQAKTRPPHFIVFCSRPEALPESYIRYLTNDLRERFDLAGIPLRLSLRGGDNPYHDKNERR